MNVLLNMCKVPDGLSMIYMPMITNRKVRHESACSSSVRGIRYSIHVDKYSHSYMDSEIVHWLYHLSQYPLISDHADVSSPDSSQL